MAPFDIVVIIIVTGYVIQGLRKGFFHEVMGLVGVIGGVFAGILGAGPLTNWILDNIIDVHETSLLLLCFTLLFAAFFYISRWFASLLKKSAESLFLGWLNKLMGGILAGFKSALILSLILMYITFLPMHSWIAEYEKESALHEPLYNLVPWLYRALGEPDELPEEVGDILKKGREELLEDAIEGVKEDVEDAVEDAFD